MSKSQERDDSGRYSGDQDSGSSGGLDPQVRKDAVDEVEQEEAERRHDTSKQEALEAIRAREVIENQQRDEVKAQVRAEQQAEQAKRDAEQAGRDAEEAKRQALADAQEREAEAVRAADEDARAAGRPTLAEERDQAEKDAAEAEKERESRHATYADNDPRRGGL